MRKTSLKTQYVAFVAALFVAILFVGASAAWYFTATKLDMGSVSGGVSYLANYFESGNGSAEEPYEIAKPEQLYNLAWLQYLGAFNQTSEPDFTPFHFYISDKYSGTLDMTGYVLPPIGTSTYPFIGYLDGQGNTVANLTVANVTTQDASEAARIFDLPQNVKYLEGTNVSGVEIIGFMGVVGPLTGSGTYASAANALKDLTIQNITVNTETDSALIGLAAGYVNGPVSNVAVVGGTVKIKSGTGAVDATAYTENLSDYGIVGYATESYLENVDQDGNVSYHFVEACKPLFVNQQLEKELLVAGNDASWGGSIDMLSMYNNLQDKWTKAKSNANYSFSYPARKTITHHVDGTTDESYGNTTNVTYSVNASSWNETVYLKALQWDGAGQYVFINRTGTSNYTYLFGRRGYTQTVTEVTEYYGQRISNNGYYLNASTTAASGSATAQTYWVIDSENHRIYCYANGDGTKYYLNYANGNLSVSTSPVSEWTYADGRIYYGVGTSGDQLYCDGGIWKVDALTEATDRYRISFTYNNRTYYLKYNGEEQAVTADNNANNASTWNILSNNTVVVPNSNVRLAYYSYGGFLGIGATTYYAYASSTNGTAYTRTNDNKLRYGNNDYLRYYNNAWTRSNSNNATVFTFSQITYAFNKEISLGAQTLLTYQEARNETIYPNLPTMFPLKYESNSQNAITDKGNTGYVISGGRNSVGDIRVSKYAMSNVNEALGQNAYLSSRFEVITRTTDGWRRVSDAYNSSNPNSNVSNSLRAITKASVSDLGLTRYDNARKNLEKVFTNDDDYIYGLHFINAQISKDNVINVPAGYINGDAFEDMMMPEDCIDFHLKTPGKITFFAGTYYSGNSNFFSLHQIFRDEDKNITAIKEIKEIYENADDDDEIKYVYKYNDGTFSSGTPKGSYVFNTAWITNPDNLIDNAVYYFEIPANGGEYALGSVAGGDGAYLMYLDIAANGRLTSDNAYISTMHVVDATESRTYHYQTPAGVDFADPNANGGTVQYANANVRLNGFGTIQFGRTGNVIQGTTNDATLVQTLTFLEEGREYGKGASVRLTEPEIKPEDYDVNDQIYSKKLIVTLNDSTLAINDVITIEYQYDHNLYDDAVRVLYTDPLTYMILYNEDALIDFADGANTVKIKITTNNGFTGEVFSCAVRNEADTPPTVLPTRVFTSISANHSFRLSEKESYVEIYPENGESLFKVESDDAAINIALSSAVDGANMDFDYDVSGLGLKSMESYNEALVISTDTATAKEISLSLEIPTKDNDYGLNVNGNRRSLSANLLGKSALSKGNEGKTVLNGKGSAVTNSITPGEDAGITEVNEPIAAEIAKKDLFPESYSIRDESYEILIYGPTLDPEDDLLNDSEEGEGLEGSDPDDEELSESEESDPEDGEELDSQDESKTEDETVPEGNIESEETDYKEEAEPKEESDSEKENEPEGKLDSEKESESKGEVDSIEESESEEEAAPEEETKSEEEAAPEEETKSEEETAPEEETKSEEETTPTEEISSEEAIEPKKEATLEEETESVEETNPGEEVTEENATEQDSLQN